MSAQNSSTSRDETASTQALPAALRDARVWMDGQECPAGEASVSVFDRGFLYGDSVFETLRTYGGRPFAVAEHVERLVESARRVFIDLPVGSDVLEAEIRTACAAWASASTKPREVYVRSMVTRGVGGLGLDPGLASRPSRVIITTPLSPPAPELYERGIATVTYRAARLADHTEASGAKLGNYLVAVLATRKAALSGAKEALVVDSAGQVLEGATSNVFWLDGAGVLGTPGLDSGILGGITRKHVLLVARALGRKVVERTPSLDELLLAREVFISSSVRELLPVVEVDGQSIGDGRPGPTTRELHAALRAHCLSSVGSEGAGSEGVA
jgi:branched-chain amino acid aminotransferase